MKFGQFVPRNLLASLAVAALVATGCESDVMNAGDKKPLPEKTPIPEKTPDVPETPEPPETPDDSCQWANDGVCDEPDYCGVNTDVTDCSTQPGPDSCEYANDGECDEPTFCTEGTDTADCSGDPLTPGDTCEYANDGECDEPMFCPVGTDATDCDEPGDDISSVYYVSNPIGTGDLGPIVQLSRDSSDVGTSISCQKDPISDAITISADTGGHEIFMVVSSASGFSSCLFETDDFLEFYYFRDGVGAFWMDEVDGYTPAAYMDCTATGLDGPYIDLRFGADQGLYRGGDANEGLEDRVEITDGEIRCYWNN